MTIATGHVLGMSALGPVSARDLELVEAVVALLDEEARRTLADLGSVLTLDLRAAWTREPDAPRAA